MLVTLFKVIAYVVVMALQVVIAIIPAGPMEIWAGYAFGPVWGTILSMAGSVLGTMIVFFLVRRYGIRIVEKFLPKKDQEHKRLLERKNAAGALILLYLIPGSPKDVLSYLAGMTKVNPVVWFAVSAFGRIPGILSSSFSGHALSHRDYEVAFLILAVISVISFLSYRLYKRHAASSDPAPETETADPSSGLLREEEDLDGIEEQDDTDQLQQIGDGAERVQENDDTDDDREDGDKDACSSAAPGFPKDESLT